MEYDKKSIRFDVNSEEHMRLKAEAKDIGISLKELVYMKVTNDYRPGNVFNQPKIRKAVQFMPEYYHLVQEVSDVEIRNKLMELGAELWQSLK
ncbi:MAG: hypothetical protein LUH46_05760 [Alistipes sp.]|nr:hypothetical protein [Alistipes sp.]